jgi:signal transduction histidine kinase
MVARMRLVLSVSALLAAAVDTGGAQLRLHGGTWLAFSGYALYSLGVYACTRSGQPYFQGKAIHWFDVLWSTLLIVVTGGIQSHYFLFYLFAILTSSFRWGYEEGARITMASVALFTACCLAAVTDDSSTPQLLMRATFLLALGHMIGHWGGSKVALQRRLALLSQVSRLSNPRFGVDRTLASTMEKTLAFFNASHCILLMRDAANGPWAMRSLAQADPGQPARVETLDLLASSPLMGLGAEHIVLSNRRPWPLSLLGAQAQVCAPRTQRWLAQDAQGLARSAAVAAMLEVRAFISAPLPLRQGEGRIFVGARRGLFQKADATFLAHIMSQVIPVIETIKVLDRMASEAASKERLKISLDLHDTAIQPYIGLKLGLSALRKKASADNPLVADLDRLAAMADGVVAELRHYAGTVRDGADNRCEFILPHLHRQAARIKVLYGIDIDIVVEGDVQLDDRMTAEVLQLAREGLHNICKHTDAHHGRIRIGCADGKLQLRIENDACDAEPVEFQPRSISERAAALGGSARVSRGWDGATAVLVEIPI